MESNENHWKYKEIYKIKSTSTEIIETLFFEDIRKNATINEHPTKSTEDQGESLKIHAFIGDP